MEKSDAQYTISDTISDTNITNITKTQVLESISFFLVFIFCILFNTIITSLKKIHDLIYSVDQHHLSDDMNDIHEITRTSINSDHDTHSVREENDLKTNDENDDYSPPPYSLME